MNISLELNINTELIKEIEEQKANTVSTVQISELESNLYDLNLQKQIHITEFL